MKLSKRSLVVLAVLIAALVGGALSGELYRRLRYPHVPAEETDVFFDIGLVFFLGFATVIAVAITGILQFRKRRAAAVAQGTRVDGHTSETVR
jgi:hypothetical protein